MLGILGGFLFIFCARICDGALGTMRTIMLVRGQKLYAAFIGFFESMIYIVVLNKAISSIDNPLSLVIYAAGFATGNYVGGLLEEKVAVGVLTVQVITMKAPLEFSEILRNQGYGVTVIEGQGREGSRYILQVILARCCLPQLRNAVDEWDPCAFLTVFDAKFTKGGIFTDVRNICKKG